MFSLRLLSTFEHYYLSKCGIFNSNKSLIIQPHIRLQWPMCPISTSHTNLTFFPPLSNCQFFFCNKREKKIYHFLYFLSSISHELLHSSTITMPLSNNNSSVILQFLAAWSFSLFNYCYYYSRKLINYLLNELILFAAVFELIDGGGAAVCGATSVHRNRWGARCRRISLLWIGSSSSKK